MLESNYFGGLIVKKWKLLVGLIVFFKNVVVGNCFYLTCSWCNFCKADAGVYSIEIRVLTNNFGAVFLLVDSYMRRSPQKS